MRIPIAILLFAHVRLVTKVVQYHSGDTRLTGFMAYDIKADKESWAKMQSFLKKVFK